MQKVVARVDDGRFVSNIEGLNSDDNLVLKEIGDGNLVPKAIGDESLEGDSDGDGTTEWASLAVQGPGARDEGLPRAQAEDGHSAR